MKVDPSWERNLSGRNLSGSPHVSLQKWQAYKFPKMIVFFGSVNPLNVTSSEFECGMAEKYYRVYKCFVYE